MRNSTPGPDAGSATLPVVAGASLTLVAFLVLANLVVVQYGRGVARTAVDEAVRYAAVAGADDAVARCEESAGAVLADLLGGPVGDGLSVRCALAGDTVEAVVEGTLAPLVPFVPATVVSVGSWGVVER